MAVAPMSHYRPVQRRLHWIMFALVAAAYVLINLHHATARGTFIHGFTEHAHMVVGLLVLVLIMPRFWIRRKHGAPPIEPPMARWAHWLARVTHWALYAFLLVQPLLGLTYREVQGRGVTLLGATIIPAFFADHGNRELAKQIFSFHAVIGTVFYFVIGLHILAALWHHYLRRDNTMTRMLGPQQRRHVRAAVE